MLSGLKLFAGGLAVALGLAHVVDGDIGLRGRGHRDEREAPEQQRAQHAAAPQMPSLAAHGR